MSKLHSNQSVTRGMRFDEDELFTLRLSLNEMVENYGNNKHHKFLIQRCLRLRKRIWDKEESIHHVTKRRNNKL